MLGNVFDLVSINCQGNTEIIDLNYVLPLIDGFDGPSFIRGLKQMIGVKFMYSVVGLIFLRSQQG